MQANIRLYRWYQAFASLHFWLPVFFLYFASKLTTSQVLALEAIYYVSVVVLEVPSGYLSDRLGRKPVLMLSAASAIGAYTVFALTSTFGWFVAAQMLFAVSISFQSGTDSSLLYDSLEAAGRDGEIGDREAESHSYGFFATALAALAGGLLAGFDLRIAYALSAAGGSLAFATVCLMTEPPRKADASAAPFLQQLTRCAMLLRGPVLLWTSAFVIAMTVFNHIPYEFFQPYLNLMMDRQTGGSSAYDLTPAVASLHVAVTLGIAGLASRFATWLPRRIGPVWALLAVLLLQGAIIGVMGFWLHPLVAGLLLLRSIPRALMNPVVSALVHPRVQSEIRATLLSLLSFAGRLCFGGVLLATSLYFGDEASLKYAQLSPLLLTFALAALLTLICLSIGGAAIQNFLVLRRTTHVET